jgi:glycolate oxidase
VPAAPRIPQPVLTELRAIAGPGHVRLADGERAVYARDATPIFAGMPDAIVAPADAEQIARILRLATEHRIPVVARGAGSNLCAGTVPVAGGIVLSTARMNAIVEVAPDEMLARAQSGVTTQALNDAAAAHGLFYPPDPGSRVISTIGGNVATCAGGLRGLKYGVTRNYVLGLTVVLPTGEIMQTGGRLWKDVAGYDLTRLLTGSEGTLGVITEVTVALLPGPAVTRTGLAYFGSLAEAGRAVAGILAAGVIPSTLEFLDRRCMDAVEQYAHLGLHADAGALLLFGDDGDEAVVARSFERIGAACRESGAMAIQTAGDITESEALLAARRCTLPALSRLGSLTILEDASVPRPRLAEMVARIDAIAKRHQVTIATFGHAGDGNLHPTCVLESAADTEGIGRAERAFAEIFRTAIELGGTITGEHGVGAAKLPYLRERLGPAQMDLIRRIKTAFDPAGILNPGKLGS